MPGRTRVKKEKVTVISTPTKGKRVVASINDEPVATVITLSFGKGEKKREAAISARPDATNVRKSVMAHKTPQEAVDRFKEISPKVTPLMRRMLRITPKRPRIGR